MLTDLLERVIAVSRSVCLCMYVCIRASHCRLAAILLSQRLGAAVHSAKDVYSVGQSPLELGMVVMNAISSLDIVRADDIDIWNPTPKVLAALQRSQGEFSHLSPDSLERLVKESDMCVENNLLTMPMDRKGGEDAMYSRVANGEARHALGPHLSLSLFQALCVCVCVHAQVSKPRRRARFHRECRCRPISKTPRPQNPKTPKPQVI